MTLYEACITNKRVVLIGEAGAGKTTDLDYLAYQLNNAKDIIISDEQRQYIDNYCAKKLSNINFAKCINCNKDGSYSLSWDSIHVSFFIQFFDFPCDENVLLGLLFYPKLYEIDKNGKFTLSDDYAISFLEKRLPKEILVERVKYNILNCELPRTICERHLAYCKENYILEAKPLAVSICIGNQDRFTKSRAFDYLSTVADEEYIYQHVLPKADDDLLNDIANKYTQSQNEQLIKKLVERSKETGDQTQFLRQLIMLQSEEGLNTYCELVSSANKVPDYSDDENASSRITKSIGCVEKFNLMPSLLVLAKLRFAPNFKDVKYDTLYNGLNKAFITIGKDGHYREVTDNLQALITAQPNNYELKGFCNYIIEELKNHETINNSKVWSINQIMAYLKS